MYNSTEKTGVDINIHRCNLDLCLEANNKQTRFIILFNRLYK